MENSHFVFRCCAGYARSGGGKWWKVEESEKLTYWEFCNSRSFFPPHSRVLAHMRNGSRALELSFSTNIAIFVRKKKAKLNSRRRRVVIVCRLNMYQVGICSHHSHTHTALKSGLGWVVKRQFPQFSHSVSLADGKKCCTKGISGWAEKVHKYFTNSRTLLSILCIVCATIRTTGSIAVAQWARQ